MSDIFKMILLTVMNWFHLLATVVWIGGIMTNVLIVSPTARKILEPPLMGKFFTALVKRFRIFVYTCIAVLVVTGIVIQFLDENYVGFKIGDFWMQVIIIKHIFMLAMVIIGIYLIERVVPKTSKLAAKGPSPELDRLQKLPMKLGITNLTLSIIVLFLTGLALTITPAL